MSTLAIFLNNGRLVGRVTVFRNSYLVFNVNFVTSLCKSDCNAKIFRYVKFK